MNNVRLHMLTISSNKRDEYRSVTSDVWTALEKAVNTLSVSDGTDVVSAHATEILKRLLRRLLDDERKLYAYNLDADVIRDAKFLTDGIAK